MVAHAAIPDLSPHEQALLDALIAARFDLPALARQLQPRDLLTLALSPAIRAHINAISDLASTAFSLRTLHARTTAIDTLEELARLSESQLERRRAAAAILRGNPIRGTHLRHVRNSTPHPTIPSQPRPPESGALHPPRTPNHSSPPPPQPPQPDSQHTQPPPTNLNAPNPLPPETPPQDPSPELPESLLETILPHSLTPRDPDSIAALTPLLAPDATINSARVDAQGPDAALAALPEMNTHLSGIDDVQAAHDPVAFSWSARLLHDDRTRSTFRLTLSRPTPAHPWRITSLTHDPNTS